MWCWRCRLAGALSILAMSAMKKLLAWLRWKTLSIEIIKSYSIEIDMRKMSSRRVLRRQQSGSICHQTPTIPTEIISIFIPGSINMNCIPWMRFFSFRKNCYRAQTKDARLLQARNSQGRRRKPELLAIVLPIILDSLICDFAFVSVHFEIEMPSPSNPSAICFIFVASIIAARSARVYSL